MAINIFKQRMHNGMIRIQQRLGGAVSRRQDGRAFEGIDELQNRIREIERGVAGLNDNVVVMHARMRLVQRKLERAAEDTAHIEYLSQQYAFVSFLPSIAGVLLAVGALTLADLDPVPFLMVIFAGILCVLSPVLMLMLGRQYHNEASDRIKLLEKRRLRRLMNAATGASGSSTS